MGQGHEISLSVLLVAVSHSGRYNRKVPVSRSISSGCSPDATGETWWLLRKKICPQRLIGVITSYPTPWEASAICGSALRKLGTDWIVARPGRNAGQSATREPGEGNEVSAVIHTRCTLTLATDSLPPDRALPWSARGAAKLGQDPAHACSSLSGEKQPFPQGPAWNGGGEMSNTETPLHSLAIAHCWSKVICRDQYDPS